MMGQEYHREKRGSSSKVKETMEQIQFREFIRQVQIVLEEYSHTRTLENGTDVDVIQILV